MKEIIFGLITNAIWFGLTIAYKRWPKMEVSKKLYLRIKVIFLFQLLNGIFSTFLIKLYGTTTISTVLFSMSSFGSFFTVVYIFLTVISASEKIENKFYEYLDELEKSKSKNEEKQRL